MKMAYINVAKAEQQGRVAAVVHSHVEEMTSEVRGKEKLLLAKKRLVKEVLQQLSDSTPLPTDADDLLRTVGVFQSASCELVQHQPSDVRFALAWTHNIRSWICVGVTVVNGSPKNCVKDVCGLVDAQTSQDNCQEHSQAHVLTHSQLFADNDYTRPVSMINSGDSGLLVVAACRSTLRLCESIRIVCRWTESLLPAEHRLHSSIAVERAATSKSRVAHVACVSLSTTFPTLIDLRSIAHSGNDQMRILASLSTCQFSDQFRVRPGSTAASVIDRLSQLTSFNFAQLQRTFDGFVLLAMEPPSWEGTWLIFSENMLRCFGWTKADIIGFEKLLRGIALLND